MVLSALSARGRKNKKTTASLDDGAPCLLRKLPRLLPPAVGLRVVLVSQFSSFLGLVTCFTASSL